MNWLRTRHAIPLEGALLLSLLTHAAVIATLGFLPPKPKVAQDKAPTLDIVLVSAKTKEAPKRPDALAQANLDRGGNTEQARRATSPLPPAKRPSATAAKPAMQLNETTQGIAQQVAPARQPASLAEEANRPEVLTREDATQPHASSPLQQAAAHEAVSNNAAEPPPRIDTSDLIASSLQVARLEALISKNFDDYQKRPKRKFIGGRTTEYRYAAYVEAWRQKVERIGNLNYPEDAKANKLYGRLQMTVAILADGNVEKIELNRSSGHPVLDEAARHIVELAAPFAPFPPEIRRDTDIIEITRTWTFTREDILASGD